MIVGSAGHRELAPALRSVSERIEREINLHFFDPAELARRVKAKDHFSSEVMAKQPSTKTARCWARTVMRLGTAVARYGTTRFRQR